VTDDDIKRLRELASKATPEWYADIGYCQADSTWRVTGPAHRGDFVAYGEDPQLQRVERDVAFVAAASPTTVIALLDEVTRLRAEFNAIAGSDAMKIIDDAGKVIDALSNEVTQLRRDLRSVARAKAELTQETTARVLWPWTLAHNLAVAAGLCRAYWLHGHAGTDEQGWWMPGCGRGAP
jgi:hypothetical protein